ncbi:unnamed protein product [Durusdinium trenchii]|uniref:Uncharacterized protein n=2 Tax=Durusdinium trenchii TaxID=1381693 RepID=A0ABP0HNA0_9DINO
MAGDKTAEDPPQIVDCIPLIEAATKQKEQGNAAVQRKAFGEAITAYGQAIQILDKADGHPVLRSEGEQMVVLKATLYSNTSQCYLSQELYRRAIDAADACLKLDPEHVKALHRRSQAFEKIHSYAAALLDLRELRRLGGLSKEMLDARSAELEKKQAAVEQVAREAAEDKADDPIGMAMTNVKERFDEICDKYDLRDGDAAGEVADWLTSGEWDVTPKRVAQRFKMEEEDAQVFLAWIAQGLDFKVRNAEAQAAAAAVAPSPSLLES